MKLLNQLNYHYHHHCYDCFKYLCTNDIIIDIKRKGLVEHGEQAGMAGSRAAAVAVGQTAGAQLQQQKRGHVPSTGIARVPGCGGGTSSARRRFFPAADGHDRPAAGSGALRRLELAAARQQFLSRRIQIEKEQEEEEERRQGQGGKRRQHRR